jgi:hypothetical protein
MASICFGCHGASLASPLATRGASIYPLRKRRCNLTFRPTQATSDCRFAASVARWRPPTLKCMKNIQVIDGAVNSVYDIFQATDEEFSLIYPHGEDVAFIDEVFEQGPGEELNAAFERLWSRRISEPAEVAISSGPKAKIVNLGTAARAAALDPSVKLVRPFAHPRSLISDFTLAGQLLKEFVRRMLGQSFFKFAPIVVI